MRSAKEKRFEDLTNIIKQIRNYKKIKDMSSMLTSFEELQRAYIKALPVISKEEGGQTPRFFIRCLVEMEDFIIECWEDREGRKNMSKNNSKSLASMRQKLRKYIKDFEDDIAKFRENPDQPDDELEEEKYEPEMAVERETPIKTVPKVASKQAMDDENSSDSDEWPSDSESSSDSSDEDEGKYQTLREKFLKKTGPTHDDDEDKEKRKEEKRKDRKDKDRRKMRKEDEEDGEGEWEYVKGGIAIPSVSIF